MNTTHNENDHNTQQIYTTQTTTIINMTQLIIIIHKHNFYIIKIPNDTHKQYTNKQKY